MYRLFQSTLSLSSCLLHRPPTPPPPRLRLQVYCTWLCHFVYCGANNQPKPLRKTGKRGDKGQTVHLCPFIHLSMQSLPPEESQCLLRYSKNIPDTGSEGTGFVPSTPSLLCNLTRLSESRAQGQAQSFTLSHVGEAPPLGRAAGWGSDCQSLSQTSTEPVLQPWLAGGPSSPVAGQQLLLPSPPTPPLLKSPLAL
jgi:hypothetical protein